MEANHCHSQTDTNECKYKIFSCQLITSSLEYIATFKSLKTLSLISILQSHIREYQVHNGLYYYLLDHR
jgi:hypothetical protein